MKTYTLKSHAFDFKMNKLLVARTVWRWEGYKMCIPRSIFKENEVILYYYLRN